MEILNTVTKGDYAYTCSHKSTYNNLFSLPSTGKYPKNLFLTIFSR